jgi:hypothetical protein
VKVGDLVKVSPCDVPGAFDDWCRCFFCSGNSNRIGVVLGPAPQNSWHVMFDCGEWRLDDFEQARGEVEVISESR